MPYIANPFEDIDAEALVSIVVLVAILLLVTLALVESYHTAMYIAAEDEAYRLFVKTGTVRF
jgi:hypothetical protein